MDSVNIMVNMTVRCFISFWHDGAYSIFMNNEACFEDRQIVATRLEAQRKGI